MRGPNFKESCMCSEEEASHFSAYRSGLCIGPQVDFGPFPPGPRRFERAQFNIGATNSLSNRISSVKRNEKWKIMHKLILHGSM